MSKLSFTHSPLSSEVHGQGFPQQYPTADNTLEETYFRLFATRNKTRNLHSPRSRIVPMPEQNSRSPKSHFEAYPSSHQDMGRQRANHQSELRRTNEYSDRDEMVELLSRAQRQIRERDDRIEELKLEIESIRKNPNQEIQQLKKKLQESQSESHLLHQRINCLEQQLHRVKGMIQQMSAFNSNIKTKQRQFESIMRQTRQWAQKCLSAIETQQKSAIERPTKSLTSPFQQQEFSPHSQYNRPYSPKNFGLQRTANSPSAAYHQHSDYTFRRLP